MRDISFWRVFLPLLLTLFPFQVLGTSPQAKEFAVDFRKVIGQQDHSCILLSNCYQHARLLLQHIGQGVTQEIGNSSTTCRFNFDSHHVGEVVLAANYEDAVWTCALANNNVCD